MEKRGNAFRPSEIPVGASETRVYGIYTVDGGRETAPPLCGGSGSGGGDRASSRNLH